MIRTTLGSQVAPVVNKPPANAGDKRNAGSIPGSGRSPGEGNGNPLQYSCLEDPMDRGASQATVYGVTKSWIRLSDFTFFVTSMHKYKECTVKSHQLYKPDW